MRPRPSLIPDTPIPLDADETRKAAERVRARQEAEAAWQKLDVPAAILEAFVDFASELSVVAARGLSGEFVSYGPIGNSHSRHILDISVCPARVPEDIAKEAIEIARAVLERMATRP